MWKTRLGLGRWRTFELLRNDIVHILEVLDRIQRLFHALSDALLHSIASRFVINRIVKV